MNNKYKRSTRVATTTSNKYLGCKCKPSNYATFYPLIFYIIACDQKKISYLLINERFLLRSQGCT